MTASQLTRQLIADGLHRSTGPNPISDAILAVEAARVALAAASMFDRGPQRDARIDDAALHLGTAQHHLGAERVRRDRSAA